MDANFRGTLFSLWQHPRLPDLGRGEGSHQNLTEVPGGMDLTGSHLLLSSP